MADIIVFDGSPCMYRNKVDCEFLWKINDEMASCVENLEDEKEIMENLRKIHKALIEGANVDDVFKLPIGGFENPKKINNAEDFVASIEEIEKMDAMLKMKIAEERQAKLSRIQMEEESKDILANLPCYENSNRIKVNLEEFMRLLNDPEKTDGDTSSLVKSVGANDGGKDKEEEKEEKKDKKSPRQRVVSNINFVERNIQLAKCGRGNLSLTDEEKLRIENLLETIENPTTEAMKESEISEMESENEKFEVYGMDPETKAALDLIDQRLEELSKSKTRKKPPTKPESMEKRGAEKESAEEEKLENENEKENKVQGRKTEKKRPSRLEEINKLINSLNSTVDEEVSPLTKEDIENLLEESKESPGTKNGGDAHCTPPQEVISELVSNAKLLMPKFKYRFDDS